jgi:membrane protease YdiL (CAAX protease family)
MPDLGRHETLVAFSMMLLMMIVWSMIVAWVWLIWRLSRGESILPERPLVSREEPPWRAGTVSLVAFGYLLVSFVILSGYPLIADILPAGPAVPVAVAPLSHLMLLNALVDLLMLIVIPLVTRLTCGARLRQFGLSFDGWWQQAAVGIVATLIAAPPVNAIQILATRFWAPRTHPVQDMMFKEFSFGVAGLAVLTAVVLAPLFEELAFRGLIQSWLVALLARRRAPTDTIVVEEISLPAPADQAAVPGEMKVETEAQANNPYDPPKSLDLPQPLELPSTQRPVHVWLAIVATSLLFASVHAPQWPAPLALFALAVVIGTVYHRTGSLIAAVFMHATFNGLSTLFLFVALLSGHKLEDAKLTAKDTFGHAVDVKIEKTDVVPVNQLWRSS